MEGAGCSTTFCANRVQGKRVNIVIRVVCVIQARMSSQRLPGKVLHPVLGRPMLAYLVERLRKCEALDGLILATSSDSSDDPLVNFAKSILLKCHRGPLDDVGLRMLQAAEYLGADAIVRISGDSPMLDSALVDRLVSLFRKNPAPLTTVLLP